MGKIPILTNNFQMGWNHQPDIFFFCLWFKCVCVCLVEVGIGGIGLNWVSFPGRGLCCVKSLMFTENTPKTSFKVFPGGSQLERWCMVHVSRCIHWVQEMCHPFDLHVRVAHEWEVRYHMRCDHLTPQASELASLKWTCWCQVVKWTYRGIPWTVAHLHFQQVLSFHWHCTSGCEVREALGDKNLKSGVIWKSQFYSNNNVTQVTSICAFCFFKYIYLRSFWNQKSKKDPTSASDVILCCWYAPDVHRCSVIWAE